MNFVIPIGCLFLKSWNAKNYPSVLTCLGEESIHATYNPCGFENIGVKWVCMISQGYIYIRLVIIFQVDIQKRCFFWYASKKKSFSNIPNSNYFTSELNSRAATRGKTRKTPVWGQCMVARHVTLLPAKNLPWP